MAKKVRHVLGISGGKDSAALAIYMRNTYPDLDIEYYTADTGKELKETYELINSLEVYLGKPIKRLRAFPTSPEAPFDHKFKSLGGFVPNTKNRWCTKTLKLDVFEKFVGNDPVISYVGIRGDEQREGYISSNPNIQSIFPFRKNIWSQDVIGHVLNNKRIDEHLLWAEENINSGKLVRYIEVLGRHTDEFYSTDEKLKQLLELGVPDFNRLVFDALNGSGYPVTSSGASAFPLLSNCDNLVLKDIFNLLEGSGVGIPAYYKEIEFEAGGMKGGYNRSRSGCFFCFFQQKIEWVWLLEQHPDLYAEAIKYERPDFSWSDGESLIELAHPSRVESIKIDYIKRKEREEKAKQNKPKSSRLLDILSDTSEIESGCASCFI